MGSIVNGVFRSHGMIVFAHIPVLLACFSRKAFNTASGFEPDWPALLVTVASLERSYGERKNIKERDFE